VIVRIWRTGIDPARAEEYERFAGERSLPMFRRQAGFLGVLFASGGETERVVLSFWENAGAVEELGRSPTYRETVDELLATGILAGEQTVEVLDVDGGVPPGA
jgi:heme-degrading monooxygenase HmoA